MIDLEEDRAGRLARHKAAAARTVRERVEEELRSARASLEAERKELAHAQALAKIGSWRSDLRTKSLLWSAETYRIFGMPAADAGASYAAFFARVHPDDREQVAAAFDLSALRHDPFMYEHRIVLADGTLKWVQERCEFFYDADGHPLEAAGTTQDITERRIAEDILHKSQQLMRIASRAGRVGGWDVDLTSRVVSWSDEVCIIHGVPAGHQPQLDEAINFYAPEWRDLVSKSVAACISDGAPFDLELQIVNPKRGPVWVRAIGEARLNQLGVVTGIGGAFQDISEQVAVAQALRQSDERFRLVVHATTDVVWDWNLVEGTCWWSEGLQTKFGYPSGNFPTRFWSDSIHPEDRDDTLEGVHAAIRGDAVWGREYRFRKADGTYAQVSNRALVARDPDGRAYRMLGSMVDVTLQRSLEERLATAQRLAALGQLAANMAHEFNNVLMGIQPFAEVISRGTADIPAKEAASNILQSVRRGKEVTAEVLRFTGHFDPVDQPPDLREWLFSLAAKSGAAVAPAEHGASTTPPAVTASGGLPRRVLIVDDERAVAEGISMLLESEGVTSVSVFEGGSAVAAVERHDPDVVLLDIGLPDVSGMEVFAQIHARWPSRRIVLMTGHYSPLDIASILELPNVGFLHKPFGIDELLLALVAAS